MSKFTIFQKVANFSPGFFGRHCRRLEYQKHEVYFEKKVLPTARCIYLSYLGKLAGLWEAANGRRVGEVLDQVNLQEAADRAIGTYSKGMLQRLAIAQALMTNPELLILDEPTSGLDPRSQWEIRQIIAALRRQGKTVLLCSHYLAEVEHIAKARM